MPVIRCPSGSCDLSVQHSTIYGSTLASVVHLYYTLDMAITWSEDRDEHLARHGVTIEQANEAVAHEDALTINPDYNSISGLGIRTIGYSASYGDLISVLSYIDNDGVQQGTTAFRANRKDRRYYFGQE